jgi:hypothetical protein
MYISSDSDTYRKVHIIARQLPFIRRDTFSVMLVNPPDLQFYNKIKYEIIIGDYFHRKGNKEPHNAMETSLSQRIIQLRPDILKKHPGTGLILHIFYKTLTPI